MANCIACGIEKKPQYFDAFNDQQSMISDGRCVDHINQKTMCTKCGLISHAYPFKLDDVRSIYQEEYSLGVVTGNSDVERAAVYSKLLLKLLDGEKPKRVLEFGSGNGLVLKHLASHWRDSAFTGIEAAPNVFKSLANNSTKRVKFEMGYAEEFATDGECFDLVFSINVIEHSHDPRSFLQSIEKQLGNNSRAILVCPSIARPNIELLMLDHIHSFSRQSMEFLCAQVGLSVSLHLPEIPGAASFQAFVLNRKLCDKAPKTSSFVENKARYDEIKAYVSRWRILDAVLQKRCQNYAQVSFFGAGEMAALLRAYAPCIWQRCNKLFVDDLKTGLHSLGKPVLSISKLRDSKEQAIIIAVNPVSQKHLADRFRGGKVRLVCFSDVIEQ